MIKRRSQRGANSDRTWSRQTESAPPDTATPTRWLRASMVCRSMVSAMRSRNPSTALIVEVGQYRGIITDFQGGSHGKRRTTGWRANAGYDLRNAAGLRADG